MEGGTIETHLQPGKIYNLKKLILFLCLFSSCIFHKDDVLNLKRENIITSNLRLDGYYFDKYEVNNVEYLNIYFLYKNGVILYGSAIEFSRINERESSFRNNNYYEAAKNNKVCWGVLSLGKHEIKIETWAIGTKPRKAITYKGEILNDTSFHISGMYNSKGQKIQGLDELYHFKAFSPKPDSTNVFVK